MTIKKLKVVATKVTFKYPEDLAKFKEYALKNGCQVKDVGQATYHVYKFGVLVGMWNPSTKSAYINVDSHRNSTGPHTPD